MYYEDHNRLGARADTSRQTTDGRGRHSLSSKSQGLPPPFQVSTLVSFGPVRSDFPPSRKFYLTVVFLWPDGRVPARASKPPPPSSAGFPFSGGKSGRRRNAACIGDSSSYLYHQFGVVYFSKKFPNEKWSQHSSTHLRKVMTLEPNSHNACTFTSRLFSPGHNLGAAFVSLRGALSIFQFGSHLSRSLLTQHLRNLLSFSSDPLTNFPHSSLTLSPRKIPFL